MSVHSASLQSTTRLLATLAEDTKFLETMDAIGDLLAKALLQGNTLLIAGNGGSAAEAQHFSAEIVGRYMKERRGYSAIALTTDTSILTAVGNDYDFDSIFARQVEALGRAGDILVSLSTSGNSRNLIAAITAARAKGMSSVSLLGKDGGAMKGMADIDLVVPSSETPRIQEAHLVVIHSVCEAIDAQLS